MTSKAPVCSQVSAARQPRQFFITVHAAFDFFRLEIVCARPWTMLGSWASCRLPHPQASPARCVLLCFTCTIPCANQCGIVVVVIASLTFMAHDSLDCEHRQSSRVRRACLPIIPSCPSRHGLRTTLTNHLAHHFCEFMCDYSVLCVQRSPAVAPQASPIMDIFSTPVRAQHHYLILIHKTIRI
jgi:hypothetical protein